MKKILSLVLVLVMLFSLAPMSFAEGETYKYQYIIKDSIGVAELANCTIETTNSQLAYKDMPFSSGEADQYTITEWFEKDESGEGVSFPVALTAGSTKELYGYISDETTGKVTYHNCASAKNDNVGLYVVGKTLPLSNPSKTGHDFTKWTLSDDSSAAEVTSIPNTQTGDADVYAWWNPITYKVHFDGNGETSGEMTDQTMTYDVEAKLTKNAFVKTGYKFAGWAKDSAATVKDYADEEAVKNLKDTQDAVQNLYAVWSKYTVNAQITSSTGGSATYKLNSEETKDLSSTVTPVSLASDETLTITAIPSSDYYAMIYTDSKVLDCSSKGTSVSYTLDSTDIESEIAVFVQFFNCPISYKDQNGAEYSGSNLDSLPAIHTYGTATTLVDGVKTGYNFEGWYATTDCTGDVVKTIPADSTAASFTFYAKWLPLNISYYDKGEVTYSGSNSDKLPKTHTYGTATTLVDGVKEGYKFGGWFKDKECATTAITSIGATDITEDLPLYALWKKYEVSYLATSSTGGSAKYELSGSTTASGAFTTTTQKVEVASTDKFIITATPNSSYYAKIYTDAKALASSSKGTAITYTLTQADIEAGITVKVLYSTNPITGDSFDPMLWVIAMASATAGAAITIAKKKAHK